MLRTVQKQARYVIFSSIMLHGEFTRFNVSRRYLFKGKMSRIMIGILLLRDNEK
jgi:hypothetical protein